MKRQNPEAEAALFNQRYPEGTAVEYRSYPEAPARATTTRSAAWVLSGHTAVVMVEGVAGCVSLFAVKVPA